MKSGTVFSIATAVGLTFASVITAFAHHGWTSAPGSRFGQDASTVAEWQPHLKPAAALPRE